MDVGGAIARVTIQTNTSKPRQVTATADSQRDGETEINMHDAGRSGGGGGRETAGASEGRNTSLCSFPCGTRFLRTSAVGAAECVKTRR